MLLDSSFLGTALQQKHCSTNVQEAGLLTGCFLLNRTGATLTASQRAALEGAVSSVVDLKARRIVTRAGEPVRASTLLLKGLMARYIDDRRGLRQLVAIHVPGDFVDLHGFPMRRLDHSVGTLSEAQVALVTHDALADLVERDDDLTRKLWFSTLEDAALHRMWTFRLGRLDAAGRLAHLISEMNARLEAVGLSDGKVFELSLNQTDLAEACGLTNVHVNRVLRQLREMELLSLNAGRVVVLNRFKLERRGNFDPAYLYLQPALASSHVNDGTSHAV